jgi:nitroimidazol reductase NimA-like FMN-containing flavoprotein (pyridoxamine 5'-phosphate oxidase superfamily)
MLIQEMTTSECLRVLASHRLGRLACARDNQPYIVPIYFAYDEPYLYCFTTPGQKVEWMRTNPLVCVEVDEVEDSDAWTSVVVFGRYEECQELADIDQPDQERFPAESAQPTGRLTHTGVSMPDRTRVLELLRRHPQWWQPGCACRTERGPEQPLVPIFFGIRIESITGRRATPGDSERVGAKTPVTAGRGRGWVLNLCHALATPFARPSA